MGQYTKEFIKEKLSTDRQWIERGLVVLHNFQTQDEQKEKHTKYHNGVGFNGTDGVFLSKCAEWVKRGNRLSDYHLGKCKKKLPKYWRQIQILIESKQQPS